MSTPAPTAPRPSVVFVNQHYAPDYAATGQLLTDLAEYLTAEGYRVRILCGQSRYVTGRVEAPAYEVLNGVEVVRMPMTGFGRGPLAGRLADYATFYTGVVRHLLFGPPADLVVTLTTPPFLPFAGALGNVLRGRRYGVWSMDLHPDAEEAVGMVRPGSLLSRTLHLFNNVGYRRAAFVVALGPYMAARIRSKGVAADRIHEIPVWNRADEVAPVSKADNPLVDELGLAGRFVVMYSGNAGLVHRFDEVYEVMRRLRDDERFFFLFVGSGPRRPEIEAFAAREQLRHFRYLDYVPRDRIRFSLPLGDVHLLTLRNEAAGVAVPSKLYGVMAAARPVVVVGPAESEPAETAAGAGAGLVVDTERLAPREAADALEDALRRLEGDSALRDRLGAQGRAVFLRHFERDAVCARWLDLLRRHLGDVGGAQRN